jgi:hypothetical protein
LSALDERFLFAAVNEIRSSYGDRTAENIEVHQKDSIVDTIRRSYRHLIIQSYDANIELTVKHLKLPKDSIVDRL